MSGFRIGKIFGITIQVDWSWLLIFALVSWSLASTFSVIYQEWDPFTRWSLALGAALLFFLSVLAHEVAHSVVARLRKIPVRNITLFLFGGVSNIQREPNSPFSELIITIVGPLVSLILGGVFLFIGAGTVFLKSGPLSSTSQFLSQSGPLSTIFIWLGSVNILVGFFNLIPGFPLDGGRILRSILWGITGNLVRATRWASWVGQFVAWLLILAGISMLFGVQIPILRGGLFNGMWIIFIGWFLQNAASQSYRRVLMQDVLEDVPVKRMMETDVPIVPAHMTVQTLIDDHIMQTDQRAFIVFDQEKMAGMVTVEDVQKVPAESRANTTVHEIMTPSSKLIVIAPEENASKALDRLQDQNIRQLPVVTENRIVGLLRRRDILRWLEFQSSQTGS